MVQQTTRTTVLVTGSSKGGIGDALAQEFHRRGCRVFATARNLDKVAHLHAMGIETLPLDVESEASILKTAEAIGELTGGKLDVLVNNAGIGYQAAVIDTNLERAKKMFNVNVFGLVAVTEAFAHMLVASQGRIVNIGSVTAHSPIPWQGMYNATKAAVQSISDTMRIEMAPLGVKVIHVVTGGIKTHFFDHPEAYDFPEDSLYGPARKELETYVKGEKSKSLLETPAEKYAEAVVSNALSRWPRAQFWCGSNTSLVWLGDTFMWHTASDMVLSSMYGLWGLGSKLIRK